MRATVNYTVENPNAVWRIKKATIAENKVLLREKDEEIAMLQAKLIWFYDQTASNEGNAPGGDQ